MLPPASPQILAQIPSQALPQKPITTVMPNSQAPPLVTLDSQTPTQTPPQTTLPVSQTITSPNFPFPIETSTLAKLNLSPDTVNSALAFLFKNSILEAASAAAASSSTPTSLNINQLVPLPLPPSNNSPNPSPILPAIVTSAPNVNISPPTRSPLKTAIPDVNDSNGDSDSDPSNDPPSDDLPSTVSDSVSKNNVSLDNAALPPRKSKRTRK